MFVLMCLFVKEIIWNVFFFHVLNTKDLIIVLQDNKFLYIKFDSLSKSKVLKLILNEKNKKRFKAKKVLKMNRWFCEQCL